MQQEGARECVFTCIACEPAKCRQRRRIAQFFHALGPTKSLELAAWPCCPSMFQLRVLRGISSNTFTRSWLFVSRRTCPVRVIPRRAECSRSYRLDAIASVDVMRCEDGAQLMPVRMRDGEAQARGRWRR